MNLFCEQLVKSKKTAQDILIIALMFSTFIIIPVLGFILGTLVNGYFIIVSIFLLAIDIYAVWYVVTGRNIEYEYSLTNGTMSVDRVMAKRRRKHLLKFDIKNIEDMCMVKDKEYDKDKYEKIIYAGETQLGENEYQALVYSPKYGNTLLVFSPDEKTLAAMKPYLKAQISIKLFRKK